MHIRHASMQKIHGRYKSIKTQFFPSFSQVVTIVKREGVKRGERAKQFFFFFWKVRERDYVHKKELARYYPTSALYRFSTNSFFVHNALRQITSSCLIPAGKEALTAMTTVGRGRTRGSHNGLRVCTYYHIIYVYLHSFMLRVKHACKRTALMHTNGQMHSHTRARAHTRTQPTV